jgi:ATP-binding cassette, subfamily B, bacterial
MAVVVGLLALGPALQAAEIWLFKILVDDVLLPQDLSLLPLLAAAYIGLNLTSGALSFADAWISTKVGGTFLLRVRRDLFGHLLKLSPVQLSRRRLGDVLARLTGDVAAIEGFVVHGAPSGIGALVKLIIFASMVVWLDPLLAGLAFVVAPAFWTIARRLSKAVRAASRRKRRSSGALQSVAEEALAGIDQVQAARAESFERDRFHRENEAVLRAELDAARTRGLFGPLADLVELAGGLTVIAAGAWSLSTGRLSLGELLAFMTYLSQMYRPVRDITSLSASAFSAAAGAERVAEVIDEIPLVSDREGALDLPHPAGGIEFDDVWFRYPGDERWTLRGVSLRIEPGSVVAVVGSSGGGKSTLTNLLLRFADPERGAIRFGGRNIADLRLSSLRGSIGLLLQDTYLFDASVRDNVAYGRSDATDVQVETALLTADAGTFTRGLPGGLSFAVGRRGRALSGGQGRRVALARALLSDAPILVLDEYSAGLDPMTARRVLDMLTRDRHRTILLVTHDAKIASAADHIVLLGSGQIVEEGPPEALLSRNGSYARLMGDTEDRGLQEMLS